MLDEIKKFEEKYGIESNGFYEKWSKELLPEPLDPELHSDFMTWYGLIEELFRVEEELKRSLICDEEETMKITLTVGFTNIYF